MTITTEQAIVLAQEVGAPTYIKAHSVALSNDQLTALCNMVREQTLLEAADEFQTESMYGFADTIEFLRRMAGEE